MKTKKELVVASFRVDKEKLRQIKEIAHFERVNIQDILDQAMFNYLNIWRPFNKQKIKENQK